MEIIFDKILDKLNYINPIFYKKNRNFVDGDVTRLSPYISRGVISTKKIFDFLKSKKYDLNKIEKFIQELAWRDYWQLVWKFKKDQINHDLRNKQENITNYKISKDIIFHKTGINSIDEKINELYSTGYMHNHMRMYVASLCCNVAKSHWKKPAKWMYYHLLDADWGSNALSWQWICGTNSNKKYFANQENINKFFYSNQKNTFLDKNYDEIKNIDTPENLKNYTDLNLNTKLPEKNPINITSNIPTAIYNFYNLDPLWRKEEIMNRILLIEPSIFEKYPISQKSMEFMLKLSKNIKNIQIYIGEFSELKNKFQLKDIFFKEHPLNNYEGNEDPRDWMFPEVQAYFPSFFKFWNTIKKVNNNQLTLKFEI